MKYLGAVQKTARRLNLLDSEGRLMHLDSLAVVTLIAALESATGVTIPPASVRRQAFVSLESIAAFLAER
jgi:acyl carrier protein